MHHYFIEAPPALNQVCQIRINLFGPLPEPQPSVVDVDNPTLQKAVAFMTDLCEGYAAGTIETKTDLKNARDKKLELVGLALRPQRRDDIKKRPCQTSHDIETDNRAAKEGPVEATTEDKIMKRPVCVSTEPEPKEQKRKKRKTIPQQVWAFS